MFDLLGKFHLRPFFTALMLPAALAVGIAPRASAQSDEVTRGEIAFASGLAEKFNYVDLAEGILDDLETRRHSSSITEELSLARCGVYFVGARKEGDRVKRVELYDKALGAYEEFLDKNPFSDFAGAAQSTYIDLCNSYGLILERELGELLGEEAQATREKMREVLDKGLKFTGDLLDGFGSELSESEKRDKYRLMLNRGQMLLTLAKISEEGIFLFGQCDQVLESLAMAAGETSGWGFNAYLLLGRSKLAQGEYEDAAAFIEYVLDLVVPYDDAIKEAQGWNEIPMELKQRRWELVERGAPDLIAAYQGSGDPEGAVNQALRTYNKWKKDGFTLAPQGYLAVLAIGNALVDLGGQVGGSTTAGNLAWFATPEEMTAAGFSGRRNRRAAVDLALTIARDVGDDNRGNILQVYAQSLIKRISDQPGVRLDPALLLEAADGERNQRNYATAIDSYRDVLRSLDNQDDATRAQYMSRTLRRLGNSLSGLDRNLEAAMAHREACQQTWRGDPEQDQANAQGYYIAMGQLRRSTDSDPLIEKLWLDAERLVGELSDDQGDITWRQGERLYGQKDYTGAREKYAGVEDASDYKERAIVKAALCLYKLKDRPAALAEFVHYLDVWVPDPEHVLETQKKRQYRRQAMAQASYYSGGIAYSSQDWDAVLHFLGNFVEEFPAQDSYAPNAVYMVLMAQLAKKDFAGAKASHEVMREKFPKHGKTGDAASRIFAELKKNRIAAREAKDEARAMALTSEMAEMMHISNSLSESPIFDNLRSETTLWIELSNWEKAEEAARRTVRLFTTDEASKINTYVLPDLGRVLLEQKRVPEAFEILDPLIPDPTDTNAPKISSTVVLNWTRAVCGWVEGEGRTIVEVPGVGDAVSLEKASNHLRKLVSAAARNNQWECPWYERKFSLAYCYYQWGKLNSEKSGLAAQQITTMKTDLEDPSLSAIADSCGDDTLQRRFQWLYERAK